MLEALSFITPAHLALVPIVIGLVQVAKMAHLPSQYAPIAAIVFGILGAILLGGTLVAVILGGIVVGLAASGLYSGSAALKNAPSTS